MPEFLEIYKNFKNVEYKKYFNKTFEVHKYRQLCLDLGFNLNFLDRNYRIGCKFISLSYDGYKGWRTTTNGCFKNYDYKDDYLFSNKFGLSKDIRRVRLTNLALKQHCTAARLKNRRTKVPYNANNIKDYYSEENDILRINIFNINKTLGASYKTRNNVIWFDIDDHNNSGIADLRLKQLLNIMDLDIHDALMIEKSVYNGGYHICFQLPYYITDRKYYFRLKKILEERKIVGVDVDFSKTVLRLPLSYEYVPLSTNTLEPFKTFKNFIQSVDFNKVIHNKILDSINDNFTSKGEEKVNQIIKDILSGKIKHIPFDELTESMENAFFKYKDKIKYWKTKKVIIQPKTIKMSASVIDDKIEITEGKRFQMYQHIIPYCVNQLNYTLEQTVDFIMAHNKSSKDIKKYGRNWVKKDISSFYQTCVSNKSQYQNNQLNDFISSKFVSNQKHIPSDLLSILNNKEVENFYINQLIKEYQSVRFIYEPNAYQFTADKIQSMHEQFPFILKEVIGSFYYQSKEIDDKLSRCNDSFFNQYIGFQLSAIHLSRIIDESKIYSSYQFNNKISSFNIQYLKKAILNLINLNSFQLKKNGKKLQRNYMKGFCTSFNPNIDNMFKFFIKLSNQTRYLKNWSKIYNALLTYIIKFIQLEANLLKKQDNLKLLKNVGEKFGLEAPPDT